MVPELEIENLKAENDLFRLYLHQMREELGHCNLSAPEGSILRTRLKELPNSSNEHRTPSSELEKLLDELRQIQNSTSWRITGPYRKLSRILRKRRPTQNFPPNHLYEEEKIEYLRWRLSEMHSSTSMLLTKPLRKLKCLVAPKKTELKKTNVVLQQSLKAQIARSFQLEADLRKDIAETKQRYKECKREKEELQQRQRLSENRLYAQLEALSWLQRRLEMKRSLPPLRGWAASPDVLLRLHEHILDVRPRTVVELGSGASTLVIADALRQNNFGKLISIEHVDYFGSQVFDMLKAEGLEKFVDLRIGELKEWDGEHLNYENAERRPCWYPLSLLDDVDGIDLLWVDGPPGVTCAFSRYPALPALVEKLTFKAEVWMDDASRQDERDICECWAKDYGLDLEYIHLEKGLGRLTWHDAHVGTQDNFPLAGGRLFR